MDNPFWGMKYRLLRGSAYAPGLDIAEVLFYMAKMKEDDDLAEAKAKANEVRL